MNKKITFLMAAAIMLLALVTQPMRAVGQAVAVGDTLWFEPFKEGVSGTTFSETTSWGDYIDPTTFVAADASSLSYSSSDAMASSQTTNVTDGTNVWLKKNTTGYVQISGILLYNTTKIKVSWAQNNSPVTVYYQFDGSGDFASLSTCSSTSSGYLSDELSVTGHTTIALKFVRGSNDKAVRVDNLTLKATEVASLAPTITIKDDITELVAPNYVVGTPEDYISYETFTVNGSNLEANVTLTLNENSNFQLSTDLDSWTNTVSLTQTDGSVSETVAVRLKTGLSVNDYTGQITLTSTHADAKTIDLSGSVTYAHVTYDGNSDGVTNVPTDNTDYSYNQQVTVLGAGDMAREGYDFVWWDTKADGTGTSFDPDDNENNKFNIIANTTLYAQWDAKSYNITKAVMTNGDVTVKVGENVVTSATTGATVSLVVTPATDYVLSELTVAKTDDATTTDEVINNQFIMPPYAVTVTATFVEHVAVFTNGVYSEPLTSQESFDNMQVVSTEGDETWVFNSTYNSSFITSEYDEIDWLITPKMMVENGKLNVSFQIYHKNYDGQLSLKWSASNDVMNGEWHDLTFSEGSQNGWRNVNGIVIETEEPYVYVAFVYDNTADDYAGQYQIRNFVAKQYYNVTFNANIANASGSMLPLSCLTNTATPLTANVFTAQGKAFNGWNTQANGSGTSYTDGANITITQNTTLYAQWVDAYTVSFMTNGVADGAIDVFPGATVNTLPQATAAYIPEGYTFMGWIEGDYPVSDNAPAGYIEAPYTPEDDITLNAVFAIVSGSGPSDTYALVSDVNDLSDGDVIILVSTGSYTASGTSYNFTVANGTVNSSKLMDPVDVTISENKVTSTDVAPITLVEVTGGWKLQMGTQYLDTVTGKNQIILDDEGAINTIEINNNLATIGGLTEGTKTRNIYYNPNSGSNPRFAYYTSTQKAISIYKQEVSVTYSNYRTSLTQEYSIHIDKHGANGQGGWYLISSPLAGTTAVSDVTNLINTDLQHFDLYRYNQSATKEWENWKNNGSLNRFNLESGKGYLYANDSNEEGVTLIFSGAPYNGDGQIALTYDENAELPGWNLIGNPFGTAATLDLPYYQMNAARTALGAKVEGEEIAAMEGVFVYAYDQTASQTIATATFTPAGRSANTPQGIVNLNVENNGSVIDNAIVRFDEGYTLPKFYFGNPNANLYIPQGEKEYAILSTEAQGELPLNFRANENGQFTLTVNPEGIEMNYLHLIDNMTGANVDLLSTPSYTFTAKTTDYESRFRLVFASSTCEDANGDNETFAFFSNGNLVVNNEGESTLQVIDVMGRVLSNQTISGIAELNLNQQAGVYVLRLVNGNDVKTQKIVVK